LILKLTLLSLGNKGSSERETQYALNMVSTFLKICFPKRNPAFRTVAQNSLHVGLLTSEHPHSRVLATHSHILASGTSLIGVVLNIKIQRFNCPWSIC